MHPTGSASHELYLLRVERPNAIPVTSAKSTVAKLPLDEGRYLRTDLCRSKLRQAEFRGARLFRARLLEADVAAAKFEDAVLTEVEGEV